MKKIVKNNIFEKWNNHRGQLNWNFELFVQVILKKVRFTCRFEGFCCFPNWWRWLSRFWLGRNTFVTIPSFSSSPTKNSNSSQHLMKKNSIMNVLQIEKFNFKNWTTINFEQLLMVLVQKRSFGLSDRQISIRKSNRNEFQSFVNNLSWNDWTNWKWLIL